MPTGAANMGEIGASGLQRSSQGQVEEEFLANLQGRKAIEVFREMADNDPVVGAALFTIVMLIRGVDWDVEENAEAPQAEEDAQFVEQCMEDMSHTWADHLSEVLTMLQFGWSFFEIVYKQRQGYQEEGSSTPTSKYTDGKVGWRKFAIRSQDSMDHWEFDDDGGIKAMVQKPPPKYEDIAIPMQKSLLFRTTTVKGSPEGRSVLRNAYRPWFFKKNIEEIEAIGIERDLAGLPVAEVDPAILRDDADENDKKLKAAIEKIVRNIKRNKEEGVLWPMVYDESGKQLYNLKLLNSGGARTFDTDKIISRYDQRILMTMLADFILLGHEKVGSFALSSDKTDLFAVAIGAWLDMIQEVYNRWAIPRLFALNGMQTEFLPTIKHGDIEAPPLDELIAFIQGLVQAGVPLFPDEQLENHLRQIASLPEKSEEAQDEQARQQAEQRPVAAPGREGEGQNQPPGSRVAVPAGAGGGNGRGSAPAQPQGAMRGRQGGGNGRLPG